MADPRVTIRSFTDADVGALTALWAATFPDDPVRNVPARMVRTKRGVQPELLLVADEDGTLVGAVLAGFDGHRGWLHHLAVAPAARRRGIGAALVRAAERRLATRGCIKVNLQVRASNAAVIGFYERVGYAVEPVVGMGRRLDWPPILETLRLVLDPASDADVDDLHRLWVDPDVRRHLWDDQVIARAHAAEVVQASHDTFASAGFGLWVVRPRGDDMAIGCCGLRPVDATTDVEVIYALAPARWGEGLATEAAQVIVRFALDRCGCARVLARMDRPNLASARVAERLGMTRLDPVGDGTSTALVYALT